jgi:galactokinase
LYTEASAELASSFQFTSSNRPPDGWQSYVIGVKRQLLSRGIEVPPLKIHFDSTLPLGAGLSSSAALEVSAALAMLDAAGRSLAPMEIARLCQQAEIESIGLGSGIMDQFISIHGRAGHAMLLDCRSLEYRAIAIPQGIAMVIADTGVKHELASSEYNRRREECAIAARALGVTSLRDATEDGGYPRARHVINENARVLAFAEALENDDRHAMGRLMAESHESLRVDYEVSSPELDRMVALANQCPGLIGARMTGGGFGGATINLVEVSKAADFALQLSQAYGGAATYITGAANGAGPQNP